MKKIYLLSCVSGFILSALSPAQAVKFEEMGNDCISLISNFSKLSGQVSLGNVNKSIKKIIEPQMVNNLKLLNISQQQCESLIKDNIANKEKMASLIVQQVLQDMLATPNREDHKHSLKRAECINQFVKKEYVAPLKHFFETVHNWVYSVKLKNANSSWPTVTLPNDMHVLLKLALDPRTGLVSKGSDEEKELLEELKQLKFPPLKVMMAYDTTMPEDHRNINMLNNHKDNLNVRQEEVPFAECLLDHRIIFHRLILHHFGKRKNFNGFTHCHGSYIEQYLPMYGKTNNIPLFYPTAKGTLGNIVLSSPVAQEAFNCSSAEFANLSKKQKVDILYYNEKRQQLKNKKAIKNAQEKVEKLKNLGEQGDITSLEKLKLIYFPPLNNPDYIKEKLDLHLRLCNHYICIPLKWIDEELNDSHMNYLYMLYFELLEKKWCDAKEAERLLVFTNKEAELFPQWLLGKKIPQLIKDKKYDLLVKNKPLLMTKQMQKNTILPEILKQMVGAFKEGGHSKEEAEFESLLTPEAMPSIEPVEQVKKRSRSEDADSDHDESAPKRRKS